MSQVEMKIIYADVCYECVKHHANGWIEWKNADGKTLKDVKREGCGPIP